MMVILKVYSKCLKVNYKTRLFSKATIFAVITNIVSIILPFVLAYNSRGFWLKHDTFYEQPDVKFRGKYLVNAFTTNASSPIACSNCYYPATLWPFDKCSLIKSKEIDTNKDGKIDEIDFSLQITTVENTITEIYLLLAFDFSLHTVCPMLMQTPIIIHQKLQQSVSKIDIVGYMDLSQKSPLHCNSRRERLNYNFSCIKDNKQYEISNLQHNERNISTYFKNEYKSLKRNYADDSELSIKLKIKFPEHKFYYTPTFWQTVKWAWLHYLSLYVIIEWIMQKIKNYVYENNLVLFYKSS